VSGLSVLAAMTGVSVAAGVLLIVAGFRPVEMRPAEARPACRSLLTAWPGRVWPGRRRALTAAAAGVVALLLTGWPVAALAVTAAVIGVPGLLSGRAAERQLARLEAVEAWTRRLSDVLGSGAGGLEQAIEATVRSCPAAIQPEVTALAGRLRVLGVETALRGFADDLADVGSPAADMVAAALILRVRRGGRGLRPVLAALAEDVADLVRARRATEADRAKPRANVRALIGLTGVVLAAALVFARGYLAPFGAPAGQAMLAVIAGFFTAGFLLMARIARPPAVARLLAGPATVDTAREGSWV
jgi:tight adherence protein B